MKRINLSETNARTINTHIQHIQQIVDTTEVGETVLRTNTGVAAMVVSPDTTGTMVTVGDGVQIGSPLGGDLGPGTLNVEGQVYIDGTPISYDPTVTGLNNLVEDLSPQLGGDLDLNGHTIIGLPTGGDIGGLADIVSDATPQLGGNLDLNAFGIGTATIPKVIDVGTGEPGDFGVFVDVGAQFGTLTLKSTSTGDIGPFFRTFAAKAAGAQDDTLGGYSAYGRNANGTPLSYGGIGFKIQDATYGTETSSFYLDLMYNGGWLQGCTIGPYGLRMDRGSSSIKATDTIPVVQLYKSETGTGYRGSTVYSEFHKYGGGGGAYGQAVWGVAISHEGARPDFIEGGRFHGIGQSGCDSMGLIAFGQNTTTTVADTLGVESEVRTAARDAPDPGPWAPGPMVANFIATCREGSKKIDICYITNQSNTTPARMGFGIGQNSVDHTGWINWANLVYGIDLSHGSYDQAAIRLKNNTPVKARNAAGSADIELFRVGGDDTVNFLSGELNIRGGVCIGWPTGFFKGVGNLNVAGNVYKNNSAFANPDYALEHYYTGKIEKFADREGAADYAGLIPIDELEDYMRKNYHLPMRAVAHDEPSGIFDRTDLCMEKIEEAFLYIVQLHKRIEAL